MDKVNVTIPANAEFLHVLRAVVASVGALSDASIDLIEDLRLAVDEACSQLLSIGPDASSLALEVASVDGWLDVLASIDRDRSPWPPPRAEDTLGWQVLRGLADRPAFERTEHGVGIRFTKRLWPGQ